MSSNDWMQAEMTQVDWEVLGKDGLQQALLYLRQLPASYHSRRQESCREYKHHQGCDSRRVPKAATAS